MFTSTTFMHDSVPNRVLTGGERTIQYRASSQWCRTAKQAGRVTAADKTSMTVEYEDGTKSSFILGRDYGVWSGTTIPHQIASPLRVGDVFKAEDVLSYNAHYFQPDTMNPGNVIFKRGIRGNMMLMEATDTLEDANTISEAFSQRLGTSMTEKRAVRIAADHEVEVMKDVGDHVTPEDILCTLKPPMSEFGRGYGQDAIDALETLNTLTPKADYEGVIERIEVIYTGDIENMSASLQDIVNESDAKLYRMNKKLGIPVKTAQVPPTYAIDGTDLGKDQVVMIYYITERIGAGIGDKFVAFNQLKTIVSNIVKTPHRTQDGRDIDITFSRQSISNRIVNSPDLIGTTNVVLSEIEREMIEAYTGVTTIRKL